MSEEKTKAGICQASGCEKLGTKRCGRCKRVRYCSSTCQRRHWESDGHRSLCVPIISPSQMQITTRIPGDVDNFRCLEMWEALIFRAVDTPSWSTLLNRADTVLANRGIIARLVSAHPSASTVIAKSPAGIMFLLESGGALEAVVGTCELDHLRTLALSSVSK